ncbi:MAG TPA: hypothetical protein VMM36_13125 [Opitutaceae bacterium]|nr:hypothetical protein [Opitutaceae bacterium]
MDQTALCPSGNSLPAQLGIIANVLKSKRGYKPVVLSKSSG